MSGTWHAAVEVFWRDELLGDNSRHPRSRRKVGLTPRGSTLVPFRYRCFEGQADVLDPRGKRLAKIIELTRECSLRTFLARTLV